MVSSCESSGPVGGASAEEPVGGASADKQDGKPSKNSTDFLHILTFLVNNTSYVGEILIRKRENTLLVVIFLSFVTQKAFWPFFPSKS